MFVLKLVFLWIYVFCFKLNWVKFGKEILFFMNLVNVFYLFLVRLIFMYMVYLYVNSDCLKEVISF